MNNARDQKQSVRFLSMVAIPTCLAAAGCFNQDHLVTDDLLLSDASVAAEAGAAAQGGGGPALEGAGGASATVTSLGDRTGLGWPIALTPQEVANRLSNFLFASPPSQRLVQDIVARNPKTNEDVGALADALLIDEQSSQGVRGFYNWWLRLDRWIKREADPALGLTADVRRALWEDALTFAESTTLGAGTFAALLTEPATFATNATPEGWYPKGALPSSRGATPQKIALPPAIYAGILTQPAVVSSRDSAVRHSITLRGLLVAEAFLCLSIPPDPPGLPALPPPVGGNLTHRQRMEQAVSSPSCSSCHQLMDPFAHPLEHFSANGGFRANEEGLPIDTKASISGPLFSRPTTIDGAPALAKALTVSSTALSCFAAHWLAYATGLHGSGAEGMADPANANNIDYIVKRATVKGQLNIRGVIRAVTETRAFLQP